MSFFAFAALLVSVIVIIALFLARKELSFVGKFVKMPAMAQKRAAEQEFKYSWQEVNLKDKKISHGFGFALFFIALSLFCAWCGLHYTCGYTAFWAIIALADAFREQTRIVILKAKYADEDSAWTVVDGAAA